MSSIVVDLGSFAQKIDTTCVILINSTRVVRSAKRNFRVDGEEDKKPRGIVETIELVYAQRAKTTTMLVIKLYDTDHYIGTICFR